MGRHGGGFSIAQSQPRAGKDFAERLTEAFIETAQPANIAPAAGAAQPAASSVQPGPVSIEGFRHFLSDDDTLPLDKQFKVDGKDPLHCEKRLRQLMSRLARRMFDERKRPQPPHGEKGLQDWENPNIPAGYTYLLQLVAHDLVQTSFPMSLLEGKTTGVRNDRAYRLKLDTIYGGGPNVCPLAYAISDVRGARFTLRLAGGDQKDPLYKMEPEHRDITRLDCEKRDGKRPRLTEALIADPRNDDHAILAQLTALFHHLHNGLVDELLPKSGQTTTASETEAAFNSFLCARGAVALMYRNVIRYDVLDRILHRDIYQHYSGASPRLLDTAETRTPPQHMPVPLEFTHGAFRFGHTMVRDHYHFNFSKDEPGFKTEENLRQNSLYLPGEMPLNRRWTATWSRFFEIPQIPDKPQYSHRIGPHFSGDLSTSDLFPPFDETRATSLAYRDLMSAAFARLWSTTSLIEEIRWRNPALIAKSRLLDDRWYRINCLRHWLDQQDPSTRNYPETCLTTDDIETLADEPPLPFFIQFEAAFENSNPAKQGRRLGVLGSIIVAEVIFGALAGDSLPAEASEQGLKTAFAAVPQAAGATQLLGRIADVKTMGQLVELTADVAKLRKACPAFL